MNTPLAGQHAVITGAGRGIGRAIALALAQAGAHVTLWSRTEAELAHTAAACATKHVRVNPRVVDVRDPSEIAAAAAIAREQLGDVSILVNNAGAVYRGEALSTPNQVWRNMFASNVDSAFFACRAFGSDLRAQRGRIINIASIAGRQGTAMLAAYCAAKHALVGFTRALAEELRGEVAVNAVCPGSVDTQMLQEGLPGAKADMTPEDIARTVRFLAVEAPRALTGSCIDVFG